MSIGSSYTNRNDSYGSVAKGQKREVLFAKLCDQCSVPHRSAEKYEDMIHHIDEYFTNPKDKREYSADIKAFKASKRGTIKDLLADVNLGKLKPRDIAVDSFQNMEPDCPSQNKLIIELQTNNGKPGWLYGKADFICFEMYRKFRMVPRNQLIEVVDAVVDKNKVVYHGMTDYCLYQRKKWGHKDLVTQIKMSELDKHKVSYRDWHFDGRISKPQWKQQEQKACLWNW